MYKLMLVDDQRIIVEGIVKLIQQMNLPFDQFVFAENGSRALEMLETEEDTPLRVQGIDDASLRALLKSFLEQLLTKGEA